MASYDSNPSPLNLIKYSQPFELLLFHVINLNFKCHKGSTTRIYYIITFPPTLFTYLNFSGLTFPPLYKYLSSKIELTQGKCR